MKKFIRAILYILITVFLILGIAIFLLIPSQRANNNHSNLKPATIEGIVKKSDIESMEVLRNPTRLKGELNVSNQDFKDIVYTALANSNVEELRNSEIQIIDDTIRIKVPYKALDLLNTQVDFDLQPEVQDENLVFEINNIHVGKLPVSNNMFRKSIDYMYKNKDFRMEDNKIILDKSYLYPAKLNSVSIEGNNLNLGLELEVGSVLDFFKSVK